MAIYYVDYVSGNDGNDGLSTGQAWKTLSYAMPHASIASGDTIKVRANQTHSYSADLEPALNADINNPVVAKGCDSSDDPWGDGSDVRPIIDFGGNAYQLKTYSKGTAWQFKHLDFYNSTDNYGLIYGTRAFVLYEDCIIRGSTIGYQGTGELKDCQIYDNSKGIFANTGGNILVNSCEIHSNEIGLWNDSERYVEMHDCDFGSSGENTTADIFYKAYYSRMKLQGRNIILASTTEVGGIADASGSGSGSSVRIEDYQGVKGAQRAWYWMGNTISDVSIVRVGGAATSIKATPGSKCCANYPLSISRIRIYLPASQKTITLYMRASNWSSLPSNVQSYITLDYFDTVSAQRGTAQSVQAFAANDTWTAFSVTVTPNSAGVAYLNAWINLYEAGSPDRVVYADLKPVIT